MVEQLVDAPLRDRRENAWIPSEKQEVFLRNPTLEVMYGGAAGGGKSDALLIDAAAQIDNPHHRALLLRRTMPDLQAYLLPRSFELYEPLGGRYFASGIRAKTWVFESGASIQLGSSDKEASIRKYAGSPYNWIGWDELTHFTEWQYLFMFSRLRSAHGLPLFVRSGTNPGGIGHDWVLNRWAPWLYPVGHYDYEEGLHARPGKTLYFVNGADETEVAVPRGTPKAMGRTFIPARVADNPYLAGGDYETSLEALPLLDRLQLRDGDWMARPARGMLFKRHWWKRAPSMQAIVAARIRYWDLASTPEEQALPGGAFTAGVRMSAIRIGTGMKGIPLFAIYVEDVVRGQWSPANVDKMILDTSTDDLMLDPKLVTCVERDPGQAGTHQGWMMRATFASLGRELIPIPPQGDKITRAKIPSGQCESGNIWLVEGRWNASFIAEAEAFPEGVKDQIDALSGGIFQLFRMLGGAGAMLPPRNIGDGLPGKPGASPPQPLIVTASSMPRRRSQPKSKGGW